MDRGGGHGTQVGWVGLLVGPWRRGLGLPRVWDLCLTLVVEGVGPGIEGRPGGLGLDGHPHGGLADSLQLAEAV